MSKISTTDLTQLGLCVGCLAMSGGVAVSFPGSGLASRIMLLSALIALFVFLAVTKGRSFFKLHLSVSTLLLVIAAGSAMTAFFDPINPSATELLFFGLLPFTAVAGSIWATIQFLRVRTLQFAVEFLACSALASLVLIVGSRL